MRRGLAGGLLGLSLALASLAWASFVITRTVLDPGRSERLADQMLDNETLRAALTARLSDALAASIPDAVPVPPDDIDRAAERSLDDPRVEALVRDGIVRVHRNALEGTADPVVIDAGVLGVSAREALVSDRAALDAVLPAAPTVELEIPTTGLAWLGDLRSFALQVTRFVGAAAAIGALVALLIAKNRPAVVRRVSFWGFGAAAFWLVVGLLMPYLARTLAPASTAYVAALVDVFFGAMIRPAIVIGVLAAVLLGGAMTWSSMQQTRGARLLQPSPNPWRGSSRTPGPAAPGGSRVTPGPDGAGVSRRRPGSHVSNVAQRARPATPAPSSEGTVGREVDEPTRVMPDPIARDPARPGPAEPTPAQREPRPPGSAPRWVEGVGYIDDD